MRVSALSVCPFVAVLSVSLASGCATVVDGHERALFYSAHDGLSRASVSGRWHWHLPWNDYLTYDLRGKHVELSEVAVQHFDLPPEVEQAANRTASANQLLGAKDVELALAGREAKIEQEKRRGTLDALGLERRLRGEQELAQTSFQ